MMTIHKQNSPLFLGQFWRIIWFWVLVFLAILPAPLALAHRIHAGLTTIEVGHDPSELQITHRLYIHDFEKLILAELHHGWAEDAQSSQFVAKYCQNHFALAFDGKLAELRFIGMESEAEFVYVYFTTPTPKAFGKTVVWSTLLLDQFPKQINLTNIKYEDSVHSATLYGGHTTKTFAFHSK